ncbi:MAG: magnesium/cobalt transporter CorA [Desulfurivibrio sp.]|nr:magnesium/cobalt transporter CorA [Desulfurivibrio sp.]MBU3937504.1 magnesium/cobalt transporter CorA [Pseudomonadota bacterium]MBU4119270.1 magnesium/cobalt transporter CorA [Pseudomonadota bacterium]
MLKLVKTTSRKAGLPPGSPVFIGEKVTETFGLDMVDYDAESLSLSTPVRLDEFHQLKETPSNTWIRVHGLHDAEAVDTFCLRFGLHPLTIEDILHTGQRPKIDHYDDYLFLVINLIKYDDTSREMNMEQISFVLGPRYLITFHEKDDDIFDVVLDRLQSNKGRSRKMGVDYLLYSLLDRVVDNFFSVLEKIGEEIEELEEELIAEPSPETLQSIHALKREMILLRKSVWPLREVINGLQRDETAFLGDSIRVYLKDLYDHTIQVLDTVETFRDIISGMIDIYLSSVSNRMNEVMKVLTIFAVIFIPLTFIAGLYGMNFNTSQSPFNMPELNWYFGYPFALFLMAATASAMLFYFKKKKWF